jgi:hypothetical protein
LIGPVAVVALLAAAGSQLGAPVQNARIATPPLDPRGLAATVDSLLQEAEEGSWIAWSVPAVSDYEGCCWNLRKRGCCLDDDHRGIAFQSSPTLGGAELLVLLRISRRGIDRVAAYSASCPIDGAARTLHWIEGVDASDSLELLTSLLEARKVAEQALAAIAFHAAPEAGAQLAHLGRHGESADLRGDALFWIAQRNDASAPDVLLAAASSDDDPDVREHAVFAMSQLPHDAGTLLLLRLARDRAFTAEVRQQAIFWLAQSSDPRALDLFAEILRDGS